MAWWHHRWSYTYYISQSMAVYTSGILNTSAVMILDLAEDWPAVHAITQSLD